MAQSVDVVIGATGIVDTYVFSSTGAPVDAETLNNDAQIAATISSFASMKNPLVASSTFSLGAGAMATGIAALTVHLQQGKRGSAVVDLVSIFGDALIMAGATVECVPGAQVLAADIAAWGNALTGIGITISHLDALNEFDPAFAAQVGVNGLFAAVTAQVLMTAAPTVVSVAASDAFDKAFRSILVTASNLESTTFEREASAALASINELRDQLIGLFQGTGTPTTNAAVAVSGEGYELASGDGLLNGTSGHVSTSRGSVYLTSSDASGGTVDLTNTISSSGILNQVLRNLNSGLPLYTVNTLIQPNGQVMASIFGEGGLAVLSNSYVNIAANALATIAGNANTIALQAGASVSVGGIKNQVNLSNTVANAQVTFASGVETVAFSDGSSVSVDAGTRLRIEGGDGVLTIDNDSSGTGAIQNTIDWTDGGSQVQLFSGLPSGVTQKNLNYNGADGTGNLLYTTFFSNVSGVNPIGGGIFGTLNFNTADHTQSFHLGGIDIPLPALSGTPADPFIGVSTVSPLNLLTNILNQLGLTDSLPDYVFEHEHPEGTAHTVNGAATVTGGGNANVAYTHDAAGAVMHGNSTVTVGGTTYTAHNIVNVATNTDLTRDDIAGMDELHLGDVHNSPQNVALTGSQLGGFAKVTGAGSIAVADGGTYDLTDSKFSGSFNLAAGSWEGTTLIGSDQNNQALSASYLGDDTLRAGSGAGDILNAGAGVDTLYGSSAGGTTINANYGLAAGSTATGQGSGNKLVTGGDISRASVSGISTLQIGNGIAPDELTLTAAQWNGFTTVLALADPVVHTKGGGTYSLTGKTVPSTLAFDIEAGSSVTIAGDTGTSRAFTLKGDRGATLAVTGNGTGANATISGDGDNTVSLSGGDYSQVTVTGNGRNSISLGGGNYDSVTVSGTGQNTIDIGAGDNVTVTLNQGGNTVALGNGSGGTINAHGGFNTVSVGGDATFNLYDGNNTANGGIGNDTFNITVGGSSPSTATLDLAGTHIHGGGGTDSFHTDAGMLNLANADFDSIESLSGMNTLTLTSAQMADLTSLSFASGTRTINAAGSGSYNASSLVSSAVTMNALHGGTALIAGNAASNVLTASTEGGDTLTVGNGNYNQLYATYGDGDTIIAGTGTGNVISALGKGDSVTTWGASAVVALGENGSAFIHGNSSSVSFAGGSSVHFYGTGGTAVASGTGSTIALEGSGGSATSTGGNTFAVGSATGTGATSLTGTGADLFTYAQNFGTSTINHTGSAASGHILFGTGITSQNLWLRQSGNNLVVMRMGTSQTVTVTNWFASAGAKVGSIILSDGTQLDQSQVGGLVTAMATYESGHAGFNPVTASGVPSDTTLQAAVTSAWAAQAAVTDSAANVAARLDYYQTLAAAGKLASITLTDSGTPTLGITAAQLSADTGALAAITGSYALAVSGVTAANAASVAATSNVASLGVADSAANISTHLDALETLAALATLSSITLADTAPLTLGAAQLSADADALSAISGDYALAVNGAAAGDAATVAALSHVATVTVSDTAANVTTNLAALETLAASGTLGAITLTDTGTPALSLDATGAADAIEALALLTGSFTLTVTDSAANVVTKLDELGTLAAIGAVTSIALTDSGTPTLSLTAGQAAYDASALNAIAGSYLVSVSDAGAEIAANLDALQALADAGVLDSVTLTDSGTPILSLTAAQLTGDEDALAAIGGSYGLAVDEVLAVDAATVAAQSHVASVSVSDSAAHIVSALSGLQTLAAAGTLTSIRFTDSSAPTLSLSAAQWSANPDALASIAVPYSLSITSVLAADAADTASQPNVASVSISDSAAHVSASLATLQFLATSGKLGSITFTDAGTPAMTLTFAQAALNGDALAAITASYSLAVTDVTAAYASSVAAQPHVASVRVLDTASGVTANLAALQTLATAGKLTSIAFANTSAPTLTLTATQFTANSAALAAITGPYNLALTGAAAASVTTLFANPHVTSVAVSDTAANVAANLDALQAVSSAVTIALTDGGTPTLALTGAQYANDGGALAKITSAWRATVAGASATLATALKNDSHVTTASVSDSAANVSAGIDQLQAMGTKLSGVTLTDGGTPALSITYTQLINDQTTLNTKISGTFTITVSGVLAANVATAASKAHVASLLVVDTAAHVVTSIAALQTQAAAGKLTSITLTDATAPTLSFTYTAYTADAAALATIVSPYNLAVTAVSAGNAATVAANSHVTAISVSDLSANLAANIDALQVIAAAGHLNSVAVTDGTQTIAISAVQAANDYGALSELTGTYKIGVSDSAANVSTYLDQLQTLQSFATTKLTITLTDGATNNVAITAAQATSDAGAIGRSSGTFHITVTDSAANVSANFAALQTLATATKLSSVVLTDGGTPTLSLTYAQFTSSTGGTILNDIAGSYKVAVSGVAIANLTTLFGNSHVASAAVSDAAANIGTNLDSLQTRAANGTLTGIAVTNGTTPVTFTYAQLTSDATALGLFTGTYSFKVTGVSIASASAVLSQPHVTLINISDTAANVAANIDALQTLAAAGFLSGIVLTNGGTPTMTITAAQGANDVAAMDLITSAYRVTVTDSPANVVANINGLQSLLTAIGGTNFQAVTLTGGGTPNLTLGAAQASADAGVIGKITSAYQLTVTDSSANVWSNIAGLSGLGTKLTTITLTDGGTPVFTLTGAQYTSYNSTLAKISGAYSMTVSSVAAANAATVGGNSHVTSFSVSDTAANLSTNLNTLQAQSGKISSIAVTNNTVAVNVTYAQLTSDATALGLFTGTYSFNVTGVTVANASTVLAQSHVASVAISDTAATVSANIDFLETLADAGDLSTLTLTDGATQNVNITAAQVANDSNALSKSSGTFRVTVTDSSANVWSNIAALTSLGTKLSTIALTDGGTPAFTLTGAQYTSYNATLAKISGAYSMTVSAVLAANAATVGGNSHVTSFAVSDTAAHFVTSIAALQTQATGGKLSAVALTDGGTPLITLTGAQLNANPAALAKITSPYNERVNADANTTETLAGTGAVNTISFSAEAQGVTANLATGTATTTHSGITNTYTLSNFTNIIGSASADSMTAGSSAGVLTGNGGTDSYAFHATAIGVAQDTAAHLNGNTIQNFSVHDGIDFTNVVFGGSTTLGFSEDASNSFGTLTVSDGTRTAALTLLGQYTTASFQTVSDGASGTLVALASTTELSSILAAAHG